MLTKKGFTLVELMAVIIIVVILVAIAIPIMRSKVDSAKWSEGKAMIGTIVLALRVYATEKAENGNYGGNAPSLSQLGFIDGDLDGKYFRQSDDPTTYTWTTNYDFATNTFTFTVTIKKPPGISSPDSWSLDNTGQWSSVGGP